MQKIKISISGVAAEIVLGNYMPTDSTIMNNWEDFYHYNDLVHKSLLLADYVSNIAISVDGSEVYSGKIPANAFNAEKSIVPAMQERALYLRTECVENAVFECEFETENFDKQKLTFFTQDYDHLFKVATSFITEIRYENTKIELNWAKAEPVGNICLLCRFENGYLVPVYDAIRKIEASKTN
ncbi:MAG: hypothetical protein PHP99_07350 [Paludibacter sp.]|jgi:hypothetical protein|nr:hypothetical protein [Paludibacter sp.]MDD3488628.1 hypothetical protein [Paludibacter sp.]